MNDFITVVGGGLAGSEATYQIAKRGIKVKLYEMKPNNFSPAHSNNNLAEIVCSNSFKSNLHTNACGLLKEELRNLDSLLIKVADETAVPAGQALAVDREVFSKKVTEALENMKNVEIIRQEVGKDGLSIESIAKDGIVIIDSSHIIRMFRPFVNLFLFYSLHFFVPLLTNAAASRSFFPEKSNLQSSFIPFTASGNRAILYGL